MTGFAIDRSVDSRYNRSVDYPHALLTHTFLTLRKKKERLVKGDD
jgi:hypothetical protein